MEHIRRWQDDRTAQDATPGQAGNAALHSGALGAPHTQPAAVPSSPTHRAGGMPKHSRYWYSRKSARKRQ